MVEAKLRQAARTAMDRMSAVLLQLGVNTRADDEPNTEGDGLRGVTGPDSHDENRS